MNVIFATLLLALVWVTFGFFRSLACLIFGDSVVEQVTARLINTLGELTRLLTTRRYPYMRFVSTYMAYFDEDTAQQIKRQHIAILKNPQIDSTVKHQVNRLLNTELVQMLREIKPIYEANKEYDTPDFFINGATNYSSYEAIWHEKLVDIQLFLDTVLDNAFSVENLLTFNINEYLPKQPFDRDIIDKLKPLQQKAEYLLRQLDQNSELYFVVNKIAREDLPQIGLDYQLAKETNNAEAEKVFNRVLAQLNQYLTDIESGSQTALLDYKQNCLNNLLVYERYLNSRLAL